MGELTQVKNHRATPKGTWVGSLTWATAELCCGGDSGTGTWLTPCSCSSSFLKSLSAVQFEFLHPWFCLLLRSCSSAAPFPPAHTHGGTGEVGLGSPSSPSLCTALAQLFHSSTPEGLTLLKTLLLCNFPSRSQLSPPASSADPPHAAKAPTCSGRTRQQPRRAAAGGSPAPGGGCSSGAKSSLPLPCCRFPLIHYYHYHN